MKKAEFKISEHIIKVFKDNRIKILNTYYDTDVNKFSTGIKFKEEYFRVYHSNTDYDFIDSFFDTSKFLDSYDQLSDIVYGNFYKMLFAR